MVFPPFLLPQLRVLRFQDDAVCVSQRSQGTRPCEWSNKWKYLVYLQSDRQDGTVEGFETKSYVHMSDHILLTGQTVVIIWGLSFIRKWIVGHVLRHKRHWKDHSCLTVTRMWINWDGSTVEGTTHSIFDRSVYRTIDLYSQNLNPSGQILKPRRYMVDNDKTKSRRFTPVTRNGMSR